MNKKLIMASLAIFVLLIFAPNTAATWINSGETYPNYNDVILVSTDAFNLPHSATVRVSGTDYSISEGDKKYIGAIDAFVDVSSVNSNSADMFIIPIEVKVTPTPEPEYILLEVDSIPLGAEVTSSGRYYGTTNNEDPVLIRLEKGDKAIIGVSMSGYETKYTGVRYEDFVSVSNPKIIATLEASSPVPTSMPVVTQKPIPEPTPIQVITITPEPILTSTPEPVVTLAPTPASTPAAILAGDNPAKAKCHNNVNTGIYTCDRQTVDTPYAHNDYDTGRTVYTSIPNTAKISRSLTPRLTPISTPRPTLTPAPILASDNLAKAVCHNDINTGIYTCNRATADTPYGHNNFYTGRWEYNNIPTNVRLVSILTSTPTPEPTPISELSVNERELFKTPPSYRIYSVGNDYNVVLPGISCVFSGDDSSGWSVKQCFGETNVKLDITRDLTSDSWKVTKEQENKNGTRILFKAYPEVYFFGEGFDSRLSQNGKVVQWQVSKFEIGESWTKYIYNKRFSPDVGKETILDLESIEIKAANETFLSQTIPGLGITVLEGLIYTMPDVTTISFEDAVEKVVKRIAEKSTTKIGMKDLRNVVARLLVKMTVGKLPLPEVKINMLGELHNTEVDNLQKEWVLKRTDESGQNLLDRIGEEYGYEKGFIKFSPYLKIDENGDAVFREFQGSSLYTPEWLALHLSNWRTDLSSGIRVNPQESDNVWKIRNAITRETQYKKDLESGISMTLNEFKLRGYIAEIDGCIKTGIKTKEEVGDMKNKFNIARVYLFQLDNVIGEDAASLYHYQLERQLLEVSEIAKTIS